MWSSRGWSKGTLYHEVKAKCKLVHILEEDNTQGLIDHKGAAYKELDDTLVEVLQASNKLFRGPKQGRAALPHLPGGTPSQPVNLTNPYILGISQ